jgi:diguanylate cyclase (GGDEF)-like protein/PAS domain S-box-containing protein
MSLPVEAIETGSAILGIRESDAVGRTKQKAVRRQTYDADAELDSYRAALNRHAIVGLTDRRGVITHVNDHFCEISKYSRAELIGAKHSILNSGHHPSVFFQEMWRTIASGGTWHGEVCNRAKDGSLYWVDTTIVPKWHEGGRISGFVSVRYDITKRKEAETALREENRKRQQVELLLRDVIETLPNGIAAFDEEDRLFLFNSALRECYPAADPAIAEGATFEEILRYAVDHGQFAGIGEATKDSWFETRMRHHRNPGRRLIQQLADDRWIHIEERRSRSGHIVGVRTDITELKRAERQIKEQAETDPLTGLSNRRVVLDRLEKALCNKRQTERTGALVLVDLDGFKTVNDTMGHDAGDELLVRIGHRFRESVRKTDVIARLGGDEFAIILWGLSAEQAAARLVQKLLGALAEPVRLGKKSVVPSASFGVAMFPEHGSRPLDLMKHADMALYQAKHAGRSTFAIYNSGMRMAVERRSAMVQSLRAALEKDALEVAFQPQVSFVNGRCCGFEALARWNRNGEAVPPLEFIPLAEDAGLICILGQRIIDKAFAGFVEIRSRCGDIGTLSVNVAAAQLRETDFAATFLEMLHGRGLRPSEVVVEVTENVILDRAHTSIGQTLSDLHEHGVAIALDDFGTGYASLAHLKRYPIGILKIDRSFVNDIADDSHDGVIARSIISLAHSLEMKVVAEGVETKHQYRTLSNMGCDFAQGFLTGKPMSLHDAQDHVARACPSQGRLDSLAAR